MNDLSEKILHKIEEEDLKPKSRYSFLLKDSFWWGSVIGASILGMFATAIVLHIVQNQDWDIYEGVTNKLQFFVLTVPYIWIIVFVGVLAIGYKNLQHTRSGYRYQPLWIVGIAFLCSTFGGVVIYRAGIGEKLDTLFAENIYWYDSFLSPEGMFWQKPRQGRLAGVIKEKNLPVIIVVDMRQKEWSVLIDDSAIRPRVRMEVGDKIKIIGEKRGEQEFYAKFVLPWRFHPPMKEMMPPLRIIR